MTSADRNKLGRIRNTLGSFNNLARPSGLFTLESVKVVCSQQSNAVFLVLKLMSDRMWLRTAKKPAVRYAIFILLAIHPFWQRLPSGFLMQACHRSKQRKVRKPKIQPFLPNLVQVAQISLLDPFQEIQPCLGLL